MDDEARGPVGIFGPAGESGTVAAAERYDVLVNTIGDGIYQLDAEGRFTAVNDTLVEWLGYEREALLGSHVSLVLDDATVGHVESLVASLRETDDEVATLDLRIETAFGDRLDCELRLALLVDDGTFRGSVGTVRDLSEQRRVSRALRESEQYLRSLVDAVEEYAIFRLDPGGHVESWNEGARRIKGYEREAIIGEHFSTFYTAADRAAGVPAQNLHDAAERGSIEDEGWRVRRDGTRFRANVTITAIRDDDGDPRGFVKVTRDTTDRYENETRLRREQNLTDRILETIPVAVTIFESDGTVGRTNARARDLLGEPTTGSSAGDAGEPSAEAQADSRIEIGDLALYDESGEPIPVDERLPVRVFETGDAVHDEVVRYERPDGESSWVSLDAVPLSNPDGVVERVLVTGTDVTERRRARRRLARQRDDLRAELDEVFDRIADGFYGVDDQWRLTYANEHARELLGLDEQATGRDLRELVPFTADFSRAVEDALEHQEPVFIEDYYDPLDAWFENAIYPSPSGASVYFRDVTERKRTEVALREGEERLRLALEAAEMGFWELDPRTDESPVHSAQHDRIFGYEEPVEEWNFERFLEHVHPDDRAAVEQRFSEALERGKWRFECRIVRADGERRWIAVHGEVTFEDGEAVRTVGVVHDVTERKERERALEESRNRHRTLVENFPNGAVALVDRDLRYTTVGGTPIEDGLSSATELEGQPVREVLAPALAERLVPRYAAALDGESSTFEVEFDDRVYRIRILPVRADDGEVFAAMGMSQDVTDRRERERALREANTQLEAATEAGAVGTWEWHIPADRFVAGTSLARTFGVDPEAAKEGVPLETFESSIHEDDRERVRERIERAMAACGDYREEYRVRNADGEVRWVLARGRVECDADGNPVSFPGALTDITERKRAERELERQRDQLATLNHLNDVVHGITDAVIEQHTREEITQTACEMLAASDAYEFAWIGEVDTGTDLVTVRAESGVENYLADTTISIDSDDPRSRGPTGRAFATGRLQVSQDVETDPDYAYADDEVNWRDHARTLGYRSSAAIPLTHEGVLYGVLNVYAARSHAFDPEERDALSRLGEVIGHAIAAVERKRALTSEQVTEVDFHIADIFAELGLSNVPGVVSLEQSVLIGDGDFLVYGVATGDSIGVVEAIAAAVPHWDDLRLLGDEDGTTSFEVRLTEPPVLSLVTAHSGAVKSVRIEDGDYEMTVRLPTSADVRQVIDGVQSVYPGASVVAHRQVRQTRDEATRVGRTLTDDLTDRQRAALETAYFGGFFEWPRESNGEDVARSLEVTPATFSQHLRAAQRKVFAALLESRTPDD